MTKWGLSVLVVGLSLSWLGAGTMSAEAPGEGFGTVAPPLYGQSGYWGSPVMSPRCKDSQRCAEWHDETDGHGLPQTLCCVEAVDLRNNSFDDCVRAFRYTPRD